MLLQNAERVNQEKHQHPSSGFRSLLVESGDLFKLAGLGADERASLANESPSFGRLHSSAYQVGRCRGRRAAHPSGAVNIDTPPGVDRLPGEFGRLTQLPQRGRRFVHRRQPEMALQRHSTGSVVRLAAKVDCGADAEGCHSIQSVTVVLPADVQVGGYSTGVGRGHAANPAQNVVPDPPTHHRQSLFSQASKKDPHALARFSDQARREPLPFHSCITGTFGREARGASARMSLMPKAKPEGMAPADAKPAIQYPLFELTWPPLAA